MRSVVALIAALAWVLSASVAEAKEKKLRLMLIDIPPDQAFSSNVTEAMNDFLAGALTDQGFEVITSRDISTVLGVERQKELLGCSESNCLAEIGGAMGADYIVRGNVAVLDTDSAVNLTLVDSKARPIALQRELVNGRSSTALIKALEELVPKLVAPIKPGGAPAVAATPGPAAGGLAASTAPEAPSRVPAILSFGVAGAGLVAAGVFCALSLSARSSYVQDLQSGTGVTSSDQSSMNTFAGIGWGSLAVGLVGASLGTYLLMSGPSQGAGSSGSGGTTP